MGRLVLLAVVVMMMSMSVVLADDSPNWTVDELLSIGCDEFDTLFSTSVSDGGKDLSFLTHVDVGNQRFMNEDAGDVDEGSNLWSLYYSNTGGPADGHWPLPPDTEITVNFILFDSLTGETVFQREIILSRCNGGSIISDTVLVSGGSGGAGAPCGNVADSRLNNDTGVDCAAPLAVYDDGTTLTIYAVNPDNGGGVLAIALTHAEIDAAGVPTDGSAVLATAVNPFTGQTLTLYRLVGGELQLNAQYPDGKPYSIVWSVDGATGVQHLAF